MGKVRRIRTCFVFLPASFSEARWQRSGWLWVLEDWLTDWLTGRIDGWVDRWMNRCMDKWMDTCMNGWTFFAPASATTTTSTITITIVTIIKLAPLPKKRQPRAQSNNLQCKVSCCNHPIFFISILSSFSIGFLYFQNGKLNLGT